MSRRIILGSIIIWSTLFNWVDAALDGTSGTTSTGTINISLMINTVVQITGITDVNLSYSSGINTGDLEYTMSVCIYTNDPSGNYKINVTSSNADGDSHRAKHTQNQTEHLPYEVHWHTNKNASGAPAHITRSGIPSPSLNGAHINSNTCDNGANNSASIKFKFLEPHLASRSGGDYADTISITVTPI